MINYDWCILCLIASWSCIYTNSLKLSRRIPDITPTCRSLIWVLNLPVKIQIWALAWNFAHLHLLLLPRPPPPPHKKIKHSFTQISRSWPLCKWWRCLHSNPLIHVLPYFSCWVSWPWPYIPGMSLRASFWLISLPEKELTTSLNYSGNQRHGVTLMVQLSKKASLTNKKACIA